MSYGWLFAVGVGYRAIAAPFTPITSTALPSYSTYQMFPSGPVVRPLGPPGAENSVIAPLGVLKPMRFDSYSVSHMLPSGPGLVTAGLPPLGIAYSVTVPAGV